MRRRYLVSGVVQGVGYRYFTWREGRRIGVTGWVRNLDDGRVEVLADGSADRLELLEAALRRGPAGASVTDVRTTESADDLNAPDSFKIR